MFTLFSASAKNGMVYFGYTNEDCVEHEFLKHAKKSTPGENRGTSTIWKQNGENIKNFEFEIIDFFETEFDAWQARNDIRSTSAESISGPTLLPLTFLSNTEIKKVENWKKSIQFKKCKTARNAFALGKWTKEEMNNLLTKFHKKTIIMDLDRMNPTQFEMKYFICEDK